MTEPLILIIEDEPPIRRFLRAALTANGYRLVESATAAEGLRQAATVNPDLIILDLGLPDLDGLAVTSRLREWSRTPIVVLSARGQEHDKIAALDAGADDYLTKPFGVGELLARMRAALRHAAQAQGAEPLQSFSAGGLLVDLAQRQVSRDGLQIHLTPIEYKLLVTLVQHAGKVVTHHQLLEAVWGKGYAEETHYLRIYMGHLRRKLELEPARPRHLRTEPGVGYRLVGDRE